MLSWQTLPKSVVLAVRDSLLVQVDRVPDESQLFPRGYTISFVLMSWGHKKPATTQGNSLAFWATHEKRREGVDPATMLGDFASHGGSTRKEHWRENIDSATMLGSWFLKKALGAKDGVHPTNTGVNIFWRITIHERVALRHADLPRDPPLLRSLSQGVRVLHVHLSIVPSG